jgi:hypothetical protein
MYIAAGFVVFCKRAQSRAVEYGTTVARALRQVITGACLGLSAYCGRTLRLDTPHRVTVLITYFHPARMNHIGLQVRNILKCAFVEKVVVSNHNPAVSIQATTSIRDTRVVFLNQETSRACRYRWRVAASLEAKYLIVVDDDILLFPSQLKTLVQHVVSDPEVPHGFAGALHMDDGRMQFRHLQDIDVHYLYEVYAVTKEHVRRYAEIEKLLTEQDGTLLDAIERSGDFVIISATAARNPRIHRTGPLFRVSSSETAGIAIHKSEPFGATVERVCRAVKTIRSLPPVDAGAREATPPGF